MTLARKTVFTPWRENDIEHRRRTLDGLLGRQHKVRRGGAIGVKPKDERRKFLKKWIAFQGEREDAAGEDFEFADGVPARLTLGGLQNFTPWRETEEDGDFADYVREIKKGTHKRPKGYAPWRPQNKTVRLVRQVKQVLEEYQAYLPLTARQIFYRLVGTHGYPKTEAAYKNLCEYLNRARRAKQIPFEHIRDDGISVIDHAHYADENAFYKHIHDEGKAYKRHKLTRQKVNIRVYCEAAGMMPQLERVCEPYSIPVYSCSGFDSLSAKYKLKEFCWRQFVYKGRPTVILHLGDHDPSGESIFNDGLVQDIHAFLAEDVPHKDPRDIADFERVALTVPGPPGVRECRGSNGLLADGAGVLWDLPEFVDLVAREQKVPVADRASGDVQPLPSGLEDTEAAVLSGVGFEPSGVDAVAKRSGVEMPEVLTALALLELKGFVSRNGVGDFVRRAVP